MLILNQDKEHNRKRIDWVYQGLIDYADKKGRLINILRGPGSAEGARDKTSLLAFHQCLMRAQGSFIR